MRNENEFPIKYSFSLCVETQEEQDIVADIFDLYDVRWASGDRFKDRDYYHRGENIYYYYTDQELTKSYELLDGVADQNLTVEEFVFEISGVQLSDIEIADSIDISDML